MTRSRTPYSLLPASDERQQFETVVIRHWDKLLGIAAAKTNKDDAFDLVQDMLLSVWEKWADAPKDEGIEFYLLHALKLRIYNYYRTTGRYHVHLKKLEQLLHRTVEDPAILADTALTSFREMLMEKAIGTLTPGQQQLFVLRTRYQYSYQKIGALLDIEPASARVLYSRALQQVKTYIRSNPAVATSLLASFPLFTIW